MTALSVRVQRICPGGLWLSFRAIPRHGGLYGDCFPTYRSYQAL